MQAPHIDPRPDGIGHAIADKRPVIPKRQRSFDWNDDEVKKLFEDFNGAIDEAEYFLGLLVVAQKDGGPSEVVDGQQRLATTTILLAAIRDYLLDHDPKIAAGIESQYLMSFDIEEEKNKAHLRLNIEDNPFFFDRVLSRPGSKERTQVKPTIPSHRKIDRAAEIAEEYVKKLVAGVSHNDAIKRLKKWVAFIRDGVRVIWFVVPDYRHAYLIFETLNNRGLDLAISDLIKVYLFSCAGDQEEVVYSNWIGMQGSLRTVSSEDISTTYIRHLWISKNGPVRADKLYDSIKAKIRREDPAIEFSRTLKEGAVVYAALLNSDHDLWAKYGTRTRKNLSNLIMLKAERIRPLLLAIVQIFSVNEAKKAFGLCLSWWVRWLIAGTAAGTVEKEFGELAQKVTSGEISTATALSKATEVIPTDAEFEEAFSVARSSQMSIARYYLRVLENQQKGVEYPMEAKESEEILTLEHIWPETPPENVGLSQEVIAEMSDLTSRLGNLALMKKRPNEDVGNKMFKEKKTAYAQQEGLELTKALAKYSKWGRDEINERQRMLARLAVKAWPMTV
ncbi:MAG: DUF262 domain-containing HNH endonuclease family protein [Tepidisphaeraceae bacterium]|jgi:hypothetical protein